MTRCSLKSRIASLILLLTFLSWPSLSHARVEACEISKALLVDEKRLVEYELEGEAVIDRVLELANQGTIGYLVEDVENFLIRNLHRIPSTRYAVIYAWLNRVHATPALVDTFRQLEALTDPARLTGILSTAAKFSNINIPEDGQVLRIQNADGSFEAIGLSLKQPEFANQSHILHKNKHPQDPTIQFSPLNVVEVSEDLSLKALALSDGRVVIKDLLRDQVLLNQRLHRDWINTLKISPDGKTVVTVAKDGLFTIINVRDPKHPEISQKKHPDNGAFTDVVFIPGKPWMVLADSTGSLFVWNYFTHKLQGSVLQGRHRGAINSLSASPNGKRLISGGSDGKMGVWHVLQDRILVGTTQGINNSALRQVAFGTDDTLACATESGHVFLLHQGQRHLIPSASPDGFPATSLALSTDGKVLAVIYARSNRIVFYHTATPTQPFKTLELRLNPSAKFIQDPRLSGFADAHGFVTHLTHLEGAQNETAATLTATELREKFLAAKAAPPPPAAATDALLPAPPPKARPDRPTTRRFRFTKQQADPLIDPVTQGLRNKPSP